MRLFLTTLSFTWLLFAMGVYAQPSPDALLEKVKQANKSLSSLRAGHDAAIMGARTGILPSDPEIEYAYLVGSPTEIGDRTDFSLIQRFDFPTAYRERSRISGLKVEQADLEFSIREREILTEARKRWITQIYFNSLSQLLVARLNTAAALFRGQESAYEKGESSLLQLNQARVKALWLENELENCLRQAAENQAAIRELCGGQDFEIPDTVLPLPGMIEEKQVLASLNQGPLRLWSDNKQEQSLREKNLAFAESLPRFSAGYYSEHILQERLKGFRLGISLPLWENRHTVKKARNEVKKAAFEADEFKLRIETEASQQYEHILSLRRQLDRLSYNITAYDYESMLKRALQEGEISLTEYFYESDAWFQARLKELELQKEILLAEALLKKYMD